MTGTVTKEEYKRRRELWYAWLRDPANKQGFGQLRKRDEFCCLGWACEVYHTATGAGAWDMKSFGGSYFDNQLTALPYSVRDWLGMVSAYGKFSLDQLKNTQWTGKLIVKNNGDELDEGVAELVGLNDTLEWSFPQIADFCETNPPGLWLEGTY